MPLHYATQGYLTDAGNRIALLAFQAPVDLAAVVLASILVGPGAAGS